MDKKTIDLHIHSTYSDGILSPAEIVNQARKNRIQLIALTDHDTIDGITEFLTEARKHDITAVYGIEITCQMNGRDLHILGYNFSLQDKGIKSLIENFNELQNLYNLHRILNFENQFGRTVDISRMPGKGNMTPIRLAYWLKEEGQLKPEEFPKKIDGIYRLFENPEHFVPFEYLPHLPLAEDVVQIIRKANGFPVLAHPQNMKVTFAELLRLYAQGLRGIEAFYPDQNPEPYLKWAQKLNLSVTAGSDFHGVLDRNERSIGFTIPKVPDGIHIYTGDIGL